MTMELTNQTPFPPFVFESFGPSDEPLHVVFCRGTFDIQADGKLTVADEQQPVVLADKYRTEPLRSSVEVDTDLVPYKANTDITLNADAYSSGGVPKTDWLVHMRIGALQYSLRVTGPRQWEFSRIGGWKLTKALPVNHVPLHYEYAFGGKQIQDNEETVFEENPVGVGFANPKFADTSLPIRAPQIEFPDDPVTQIGVIHRPAGCGPIAKHWLPRRNRCGTADAKWKESRWPMRPTDFDFGYYQCAPNGLRYRGYINGNEKVEICGCSVQGKKTFQLPGLSIAALLVGKGFSITVRPMLVDTLHIDLGREQAYLTWRLTEPKTSELEQISLASFLL